MDWEKHFRAKRRDPAFYLCPDGMGGLTPCAIGPQTRPTIGFGGIVRGVAQGDGAVIPPGRYWTDVFGDKRQVFLDWAKSKPEVQIQSTQEDNDADPPHLFVVLTIPTTSSNFGSPGVWYPTKALGFLTVADSTVHTSDDVVQRPPPPTSGDILGSMGSGIGSGISGALSKIDFATMVKIGAVVGVVILAATLPTSIIKSIPRNIIR